MHRNCDRNFVEKLYFQEIENKDKIQNKIQMVFGLIVIVVTTTIYLIKNTSLLEGKITAAIVIIPSIISLIFIGYSCWLLRKAFWGNEFKFIPSPSELKLYYDALVHYEDQYKTYCQNTDTQYNGEYNPLKKLDDFIMEQLIDCSSWNIDKNGTRSSQVYWAIKHFFYALIPLGLAVVVFLTLDLDAASPRQEKKIEYIIIPTNSERI